LRGRGLPGLALALAAYATLAVTTVNGVGVVGEVAIGWSPGPAPVVVTDLATQAAGPVAWGPFAASGTRPLLSLGDWPLAVNTYTGGLPDWPARVAAGLAGWEAAGWVHLALGGLLLTLAHRFLRFHGTEASADAVALLLATDWAYVYYRKVLGGTEVLLGAAGLLVIWALWSRRWRGGVHGTVAIAVGVGLGLHAKLTFGATLFALAAAAALTRWDRAALKPPRAVAWWVLVAVPAVGLLPLGLANLAWGALDPTLQVPSHDTLALQLARWGAPAPARETAENLLAFFGDPNRFFHLALRGPDRPALSWLRLLGFVVTLMGAAAAWRQRSPSPSEALLRFLSIAVPLQVAALFFANRDLHHLGQVTVPLALLVALAADRAAAALASRGSGVRRALTLLLILPHLVAGALHLRETDRVLAQLPGSTFTEAGQRKLVDLVRGSSCAAVYTTEYEIMGVLELRAPEVQVTHLWGAVARGERDGKRLLPAMRGACWLQLRPTAPMVYTWNPREDELLAAATGAEVQLLRVGRLTDAKGGWATLWSVQ